MADDKCCRPLERSDPEFWAGEEWLREKLGTEYKKPNPAHDPDARPSSWIYGSWVFEERPVGGENEITAAWAISQANKHSAVEYDRDREIPNLYQRTKDKKRDQEPHRRKDRHKNKAKRAADQRARRARKKEEQVKANDRLLDAGQEGTYARSDNAKSPGAAGTARGADKED
jgi:hypothetical protein